MLHIDNRCLDHLQVNPMPRSSNPTSRTTTSRTVALPKSLWKFVDAMVADGAARSSDEYLEALVRQARKEDERSTSNLEAKLQAGIDSGPPILMDDAFWRERRERLMRLTRTSRTRR